MNDIIVSLTSWKARINEVSKRIFEMESQTLKPDLIVLTLSTDEFTNGFEDLPSDLILMYNKLNNFEIQWVKENTKAFKKLIPTLHKYINLDCWICTIDDDIEYHKDYISTVIKFAKDNFGKFINPNVCGNRLHGAFACYHTSYFRGTKIFHITPADMITMVEDDRWYTTCLNMNKIYSKSCNYRKCFNMRSGAKPLSNNYSASKKQREINSIINKYFPRKTYYSLKTRHVIEKRKLIIK